MSESLRQALVEFLNLQGEAVYPTAAIELFAYADGEIEIEWRNDQAKPWMGSYFSLHDFAQFLLEYSIV